MKKALLALMLVLALVLSGCTLVTVDKDADNARVIIDVDGTTVTKKEFNDQVEYQIAQNEQMNTYYGYFGMAANLPTDEASVRESVRESLINSIVLEKKLNAEGYVDALTEEEIAAAQTSAEEDWQSQLDTVKSYYFSDTELEGDELTAELEKYIADNYGVTKDEYIESSAQSARLSTAYDKLRADTVADVTVSDEEVQARLDELAESDKATLDADPALYGQYLTYGQDVYYVPAGYRMVKHILVKPSDEDQAKLDELSAALTEAQTALNDATAEPAEEAAAEEGEKAEEPAAEVDVEALTKAVEDAQAAYDAANDEVFAALLEKANEVYALAAAEGADFDALIAEYNTDTGAPEEGYAICEGTDTFVQEFTDAALALEKIGDVSEPVRTTYGYHILQYSADLEEGPVSLESVYDTLKNDLLSSKQDTLFTETVAQWVSESNVKTYMEKLDK